MRFKDPELKYKNGDTRIVRRFLFFPTRFYRETRWLEFANIIQVYCYSYTQENEDRIKGRKQSGVWLNRGWAPEPDPAKVDNNPPIKPDNSNDKKEYVMFNRFIGQLKIKKDY